MKPLLILATATLLTAPAFAQGDNISAPTAPRRAYAPLAPSPTEGSLQRGVRVGNPLQMINPLAPAKYGDGSDFVTARDEDPGLRPRDTSRPLPIGLRLFSITF